MTTRTLTVHFPEPLECACDAEVALCIADTLVAPRICPDSEEDQTWNYHYIIGTLTSQCPVINCGVTSWKYTIEYDDEQITEGMTLKGSQVYGVICLNTCLMNVVTDLIGGPVTLSADEVEGTLTLTDSHGCETTVAIPGAILAIGVLDSEAKSANGAVIAGTDLVLQSADATFPGLITETTQTIAGNKTLTGNLILSLGNQTISAGTLTFGAAASRVIPGATSLSLRNNANSADNLLISDAGAATIRAGLTVTAGGVVITAGGETISAGNLTLTLGNVIISAGTLNFGAATSQIIPGATSFAVRNNANGADNLIITDAGAATIRAGLTVTAGGVTVTAGGATITAGDLTVTAGNLVFGAAVSRVVPGATSLSFRNNANGADNLIITDAGVATIRAGLTITAGGATITAGDLRYGAASFGIYATTVDTADTAILNLGGGGAGSSIRGAIIQVAGNENGSIPGQLWLQTGAVNNVVLILGTTGASGTIQMRVGTNVTVYTMGLTGFSQDATNGPPLVFNRANTTITFNGTMGNSSKDPATVAPDDWVEVKIGATTYYLPAYLA